MKKFSTISSQSVLSTTNILAESNTTVDGFAKVSGGGIKSYIETGLATNSAVTPSPTDLLPLFRGGLAKTATVQQIIDMISVQTGNLVYISQSNPNADYNSITTAYAAGHRAFIFKDNYVSAEEIENCYIIIAEGVTVQILDITKSHVIGVNRLTSILKSIYDEIIFNEVFFQNITLDIQTNSIFLQKSYCNNCDILLYNSIASYDNSDTNIYENCAITATTGTITANYYDVVLKNCTLNSSFSGGETNKLIITNCTFGGGDTFDLHGSSHIIDGNLFDSYNIDPSAAITECIITNNIFIHCVQGVSFTTYFSQSTNYWANNIGFAGVADVQTWTPTMSAASNVSTFTVRNAIWEKKGDYIEFKIYVTLVLGSVAAFSCSISIPVLKNFTTTYDVYGNVTARYSMMEISALTATDKINLQGVTMAGASTTQTIVISGIYKVN